MHPIASLALDQSKYSAVSCVAQNSRSSSSSTNFGIFFKTRLLILIVVNVFSVSYGHNVDDQGIVLYAA